MALRWLPLLGGEFPRLTDWAPSCHLLWWRRNTRGPNKKTEADQGFFLLFYLFFYFFLHSFADAALSAMLSQVTETASLKTLSSRGNFKVSPEHRTFCQTESAVWIHSFFFGIKLADQIQKMSKVFFMKSQKLFVKYIADSNTLNIGNCTCPSSLAFTQIFVMVRRQSFLYTFLCWVTNVVVKLCSWFCR